jgi:5-methylcytosine-specific restriction endonuclease McrA
MSRSWVKGSTPGWRKTRAGVLARDGYVCQLKLEGCATRADQVHHTVGRSASGDDPQHLVAACRSCNLKVGDPSRASDPSPRPRTRW